VSDKSKGRVVCVCKKLNLRLVFFFRYKSTYIVYVVGTDMLRTDLLLADWALVGCNLFQ
jgi:hypothetical protein